MLTSLSRALQRPGVGALLGDLCWTLHGEARADACTSLRDPGLFGWAGPVRRLLRGYPAWVQPRHVPFSVPGSGIRTRAVAGAQALCEGTGLGAGH